MRPIPNIRFGTECYPEEVARRLRAVNIATWIATATHAGYAVVSFLDFAHWQLAVENAVATLLYAGVPVRLKVIAIDAAATRTLPDQELASVNGGAIAARVGPNDTMVPEIPVYKVVLSPADDVLLRNPVTGTVVIDGRAVSPASLLWRRALGIVIRESGF